MWPWHSGIFRPCTVFHFSFLRDRTPRVSELKKAPPSSAFLTDIVQFEEATASQLDGVDSFELTLGANVKEQSEGDRSA
jgi:hypothetical protein